MEPLSTARDFFADHAESVWVVLGAAYPANPPAVKDFHFERADAWAVVGAGGRFNRCF